MAPTFFLREGVELFREIRGLQGTELRNPGQCLEVSIEDSICMVRMARSEDRRPHGPENLVLTGLMGWGASLPVTVLLTTLPLRDVAQLCLPYYI